MTTGDKDAGSNGSENVGGNGGAGGGFPVCRPCQQARPIEQAPLMSDSRVNDLKSPDEDTLDGHHEGHVIRPIAEDYSRQITVVPSHSIIPIPHAKNLRSSRDIREPSSPLLDASDRNIDFTMTLIPPPFLYILAAQKPAMTSRPCEPHQLPSFNDTTSPLPQGRVQMLQPLDAVSRVTSFKLFVARNFNNLTHSNFC